MSIKRDRVFTGCYIILTIAISGLLFYKCRFGFGNIDEAFYLTVPYRLFLGDSLFWDEWNLAQMSGALLYPFVEIYLKSTASTEGIILVFRYLFTVLHILTAILIFCFLRKESLLAASFLSLFYLAYTPFGIMALSYNSMGLGCMVVFSVLLLSARSSRIKLFLSGVFFAFAVLCCPYLILSFLICPFFLFRAGKATVCIADSPPYGLRAFLFWLCGITAVAAVFFLMVFSRILPWQFLQSIPHLLHDPKHRSTPPFQSVVSYFSLLFGQNNLNKLSYLLAAVLWIGMLLDKKRANRKEWYLLGITLIVLVQTYNYMRTDRYVNGVLVERSMNFLMLPFNLYLPLLLLFQIDNLYCTVQFERVVRCFIIPGVLYTFCVHFASDQGLYNIGSASFLILMGTIILLCSVLKTVAERDACNLFKRYVVFLITVSLTFGLASMVYLRYNTVFWETGMSDQTQLLTKGPEKGIFVTDFKKKEYNQYLKEVEDNIGAEKVLFFSKKTWLYLIRNNEFASFSAWLSESIDDITIARLEEYYEINPDKFPEKVFCDEKYRELIKKMLNNCNYSCIETETGNIVYEIY